MIRIVLSLSIALAPTALLAQSPATQKTGAPSTKKDQPSPSSPIDLDLAKTYFAEAKRLAEIDGGKLWGKSMAGPMLFIDPRSRRAVANQADAEGVLKEQEGVFVGNLPPRVPLANTAYRWSGTHWSMMLWPLPTDKAARATLLMHESWHRIQGDLGLPSNDPANPHLDSLAGRYWLQLEWRALARALHCAKAEQALALEDALSFRAHRRGLFPAAAGTENALELNEGLAEYTGIKLNGLPEGEQRAMVAKRLKEDPAQMATFIRSFAYFSGPAYGLLLDEHSPGWQKRIKPGNDLGLILAKELNLKVDSGDESALRARAARYDAEKLSAAEGLREETRVKKVAAFRQLLVEGPVLILPLTKQQMSFNPSQLVPIEGVGTVYPTLTLIGPWGTLKVQKAALIWSEFKRAAVSAPTQTEGATLRGDGWELSLEPGWKAIRGQRKGDWILSKES